MVAPGNYQQRLGTSLPAMAEFCRRHGLRELSIFGSVLRVDFRPDSDVDVLIELNEGEIMTIERFIAIQDELQSLFHRPVDLIQKPLLQNPYRRGEILRTREVLYAA
jgi:predicted nucleotidyltransferase